MTPYERVTMSTFKLSGLPVDPECSGVQVTPSGDPGWTGPSVDGNFDDSCDLQADGDEEELT